VDNTLILTMVAKHVVDLARPVNQQLNVLPALLLAILLTLRVSVFLCVEME
jgi:hypothetical protein